MRILSIETSCDETAVSIIRAEGGLESPSFSVLGNALYSQVAVHAEYGGVYPNLAKREHSKNLVPLLTQALTQAGLAQALDSHRPDHEPDHGQESAYDTEKITTLLAREGDLGPTTLDFLQSYTKPEIDMIAVTAGPGLEPALWVGISFAKALGEAWRLPVVPTNHMKGHIASVLVQQTKTESNAPKHVTFPALSLLISGGHTEFVLTQDWNTYEIIGQTRDDAVGEAFDKVARMFSLPYPGGPRISALAEQARLDDLPSVVTLPRPMIRSQDFDFSFSGLKTSVLYFLRDLRANTDIDPLTDTLKAQIAREFEDAVVDVLVTKTRAALDHTGAQTLIVAGGVIANKKIREAFRDMIGKHYSHVTLCIPEKDLATDNAIMIACAAYIEIQSHPELLTTQKNFIAEGNMKF